MFLGRGFEIRQSPGRCEIPVIPKVVRLEGGVVTALRILLGSIRVGVNRIRPLVENLVGTKAQLNRGNGSSRCGLLNARRPKKGTRFRHKHVEKDAVPITEDLRFVDGSNPLIDATDMVGRRVTKAVSFQILEHLCDLLGDLPTELPCYFV